METKAKTKRDIIKNILIIFLIAMLLLTFFSNTIMNRSLPEVATQYASYKQISDKIRASGTVAANQDYSVVCDEAREITEVLVRRGDRIERGSVLFVLSENESSELSDAETELNNLLIQKQQKLMDANSSIETDYDYDIEQKRLEISELEQKLSLVPEYETKLNTLEKEIETLSEALENPNDKLEELNGKMSRYETTYDTVEEILTALNKDRAEYTAKKNTYDTAKAAYDKKEAEIETLEADIEAIEKEKDEYQEKIDSAEQTKLINQEYLSSIEDYSANLTELLKAVNVARAELSAIENEYYHYTEVRTAKKALEDAIAGGNSDEIAQAQKKYDDLKEYYDELTGGVERSEKEYTELINARRLAEENASLEYEKASGGKTEASKYEKKIAEAESTISKYTLKVKDCTSRIDKINKEISALNKDIAKLSEEKSEAESDMKDAEANVKSGESKYNYALLRDEADLLKGDIKTRNKTLDKKQEELEKLKTDSPGEEKSLNEQLRTKEKELSELQRKNEAEIKNRPYSQAIRELELKNLNDSIERKQKEIAMLRENLTETEIISPVSGTVTSVSFSAGEEITAGSTVATIALSEKGYTMEFSATNEQCQRIKVGDRAELQNYYYGSRPELIVSAFKNDPSNPGRGKIVVVTVTGDNVEVGQNLSFTIGDKSRSYDKVVPSSAVREDSNGKFVLVVDSKSTPLGNRYTARRVSVEVLTSDETSSALSGELLGGEFIITTSSAPVSDGMQVRLADQN